MNTPIATYTWDISKPYHKQDIYKDARTYLSNGHDVRLFWSQTGEHKDIQAGKGWQSSLKTHVAVLADIDEYADGLTILN